MDRSALSTRLKLVLRDGITTWSAHKEPAYRRLSRAYRLPDGERRIYCYHVRKSAGTSLHYSFLGLGGEDPTDVHRRIAASPKQRTISGRYAFAAHQLGILEQGRYFYGWSHLPAHQISLRPGTFTITILRDPVDRVISHYNYIREGDRPGMLFPVPKAERALADNGFSAFVGALPKKHLMRQLFMFSASFNVSEATERIAQCSCILFTETFGSGVAGLGQRLDLPLELRRERVTHARVSPSRAELESLRDRLEPEYELMRQVSRLSPDVGGRPGSH